MARRDGVASDDAPARIRHRAQAKAGRRRGEMRAARDYDVVDGSPGQALLRLFMGPLGLTAYRLSADLGVPPIAVSEILRGRRAISAVMAARLGIYFGVEPHFWLALQSAYELQVAENGADGQESGNGVARCAALADRQFVIRETKAGTSRRYEVILAKVRAAPFKEAREIAGDGAGRTGVPGARETKDQGENDKVKGRKVKPSQQQRQGKRN